MTQNDIETAATLRCIKHCAETIDGRGMWREEHALARFLARDGQPDAVDVAVAAACRNVGAFIGQRWAALGAAND